VHRPSAANQATFAKQETVVTAAHAARLTAGGSLVNADRAVVPAEKLTGYALNPNHDLGGNKARLFQSILGMDASHSHNLEMQLREGIKTGSAIPGDIDEHGVRFAVEVPVVGPKGSASVRSAWIYKSSPEEPSLTSVRVKIK
jgi:filamentous hemagglutinin